MSQSVDFDGPVQFLADIKGVVGPQRSDFTLIDTLITGYEVSLDTDTNEITIKLRLSKL